MEKTSIWLIFILGILSRPAFASAGDVVETSMGLALFNTVRNHPLGAFLAIILVLGAIAAIAIYVVRQVKREARGYMDHGRERWGAVRRRFGPRDEEPGREQKVDPLTGTPPAAPLDNVHRDLHIRRQERRKSL